MKKFRFPLQKVLNYKNAVLDDEKNKLAVLRQELHRIENEIEENRRQLLEDDQSMKETAARGVTVFELQSMSFKIDNARRYIEALERDKRLQEKKIEKQLEAVVKATQDVNGLERLREKQLAAYNEELQKEENQTIGELVGSQYTRGLENFQS